MNPNNKSKRFNLGRKMDDAGHDNGISEVNGLLIVSYRLVERFLLDDYEERTSSTHALTMYRYNYKIDNKAYKVGKWFIIK